LTTPFILAYDLAEAFGLERGTICCAACRRKIIPTVKKLNAVTCQGCGHPHVYIRFEFDGKPYYLRTDKHDTAYTYATAAKALIDINNEIKARTFEPREWQSETIAQRLFEREMESWLERRDLDAEKGSVASKTTAGYRGYARNYYLTSPHLTGRDVREIRLKHLQLFYDSLPNSAKYRKNIMDALRSFFRWLKRWGEILEVPTWPEIDTVVEPVRFSLTVEDQAKALTKIPEEHRDIFEFMMETGLRPGEVCALMIIDVDAKHRRILVRRTYSNGKLRNRTKQKKEFWRLLSDRAWDIVSGNMRPDFPFVFCNSITGRGYRYEFLQRLWKAHTGLSEGMYEACRHSYCSQMAESDEGLSPKHLQELMGHADIRSTMKYIHPSEDKLRAALNKRTKPRRVINIQEAKRKK
jgi:integrase